jgi:PAS domain-containing protein
MKVICSYCEMDLGEKEPLENQAISHGMCRPCRTHFRRQWKGLSLSDYLDAFSFPVAVVDGNVRMVAANRSMADLAGRTSEELVGLLGGDAVECAYARRAGGCGRTIHCKTCTIRNAVAHTFETGEPCTRVPASVDRHDQRVRFLVSTFKQGPAVRVLLESAEEGEAGDARPES